MGEGGISSTLPYLTNVAQRGAANAGTKGEIWVIVDFVGMITMMGRCKTSGDCGLCRNNRNDCLLTADLVEGGNEVFL